MFPSESLLPSVALFALYQTALGLSVSSTTNTCTYHIDDRSSAVTYTGAWQGVNQDYDVEGTASYPTADLDSFSVKFRGSQIGVYGSLHANSTGAIASFSVDGAAAESVTFESVDDETYQNEFWTSSDLEDAEHILTVNVVHAGFIGFDYFRVASTESTDGLCLIDVDSPAVVYTGLWNRGGMELEFEMSVESSNTIGDYFTLTFTGTQIEVLGSRDYASGGVIVAYSIDNGPPTNVTYDATASGLDEHYLSFWTSPVLSEGEHTLQAVMVNTSGIWDPPTDQWGEGTIWFDFFKVTGY